MQNVVCRWSALRTIAVGQSTIRDLQATILPLRLRLAALAFLLLPLAGAAAEPAARKGTVSLSNGETCAGDVYLTEGKTLDLFEVTQQKKYCLTLAEITHLSTEIEEETMADGWMFIEEGSDKKVKLPFKYPLRKYFTVVRLTTGQVLKGHTVSIIYVKAGDDDERRLALLANHKGEKGQKLDDLIYIKEIRFDGAPAPDAAPAKGLVNLLAALPGAREARVVDAERDKGFDLKRAKGGDSFRCDGLLSGTYDVFALADSGLRGFLTVPSPAEGRALTDADRAALKERVAGIEEFFDEKRVLAVAGGLDRAKVLLEMRRLKPTTMTDEGSGQSFKFIRWEVWSCHRLDKTWEIDARVFLFRARLAPDAEFPDHPWKEAPGLGGIKLTGNSDAQSISVDLK